VSVLALLSGVVLAVIALPGTQPLTCPVDNLLVTEAVPFQSAQPRP
jgi:hypothetical protein